MLSANSRSSILFNEVLDYAAQDQDRFFLVSIPGRLANGPDVRDRHRVAVFADVDWDDPEQEAVLAGFLRHEVRHAEQWDELGQDFFDLYDLAELVCQWKVGGLPRGGILYGLIPAEMDANAAAAKLLRERRPEAINAVLSSDYNALARSNTDPGALSDLPTKMIAFLYLLREVADDPTRSQRITFEKRLRLVSARAART